MKNKNHIEYNNLDNTKIGYINIEGKNLIFTDTETGRKYKITKKLPNFWQDGDVAKVSINFDNVTLMYVFPQEENHFNYNLKSSTVQGNKKNRKNRKKQVDKTIIEELRGYKILIITAENSSSYKNYLNSLCDLEIINAYESSLQRVKEKMLKSDVCIICVNAVPHAVTDFLRKNKDIKYQVMNNPRNKDILNKIRYVISHKNKN